MHIGNTKIQPVHIQHTVDDVNGKIEEQWVIQEAGWSNVLLVYHDFL